jgi:hypothetical protein
MYISDSWMVGLHLIATTAKLRNQEAVLKKRLLSVALGVPIELSMLRFFPSLYDAHIPLIICPGLEDGMFVSMIQSYSIDRICDLAVIRAWGFEYHGDAHKVLLKAVDELHMLPIEESYAKIIPIAQSSGMGKSKTVDRVATERILFPICLREDIGKDSFGA